MSKQNEIILIILAVVIIGVLIWFFGFKDGVTPEPATNNITGEEPTGLGSEILNKVQNPVEGEIADSNPVKGANPLGGAYENPFDEGP